MQPPNTYRDPSVPPSSPSDPTGTFRRWANLKLGQIQFRSPLTADRRVVRDMSEDLRDGVLLAELIGSLFGLKQPIKIHYQPRVSSRMVENILSSLAFLKEHRVTIPLIDAESLHKGELRSVNQLIWSLVVRFQLGGDGKREGSKKSVLAWTRAVLPQEKIPNLTTSWNNGMLLSKLISYLSTTQQHSFMDPSNHAATCGMLLNTARRDLGIPSIISPEYLSSTLVDEESVATFLSLFSVAMSANLLKWLKEVLGVRAPKSISPDDWRNGELFGQILSSLYPEISANQRELKDLFSEMRDKLGVTAPFTPVDLRSGRVDLVSFQTLLLRIRHCSRDTLPLACSAIGRGLVSASTRHINTFSVDTSRGGRGELNVLIRCENGDTVETSIKREDTVTHVSYQPTTSGTIRIDILWADRHIPNSPYRIQVTDATAVKIVNRNNIKREIQVRKECEVLVSSEGAGEGRVSGQVRYPGGHGTNTSLLIDGVRKGALHSLTLLPQTEGEVVLEVLWDNSPIQEPPLHLTAVSPPAYHIDTSNLPRDDVTGELVGVGVGEGVCVCVRADHGPVRHLTAVVTHSDTKLSPSVSLEKHRGYWNVWITPDTTGYYEVCLETESGHIPGSPLRLPATDATKVCLESPTQLPRHLQLDCPLHLLLSSRNSGPGQLTFQCDGPVTCSINRTGHSIAAVLLSGRVGEFVCGLKWGSEHIPHSPFRVSVCDVSTVSVSSEVFEERSALIGEELEFIILYHLTGSADFSGLVVSAAGPNIQYDVAMQDEGLGQTVASFTPCESGEHKLEIFLGEIEIEQSPFYFEVSSSQSMNSSAYGDGLKVAESGSPAHFYIRSPELGLLTSERLFARVHSMHGDLKLVTSSGGDGTYRVGYTPKRPGAYLVEVWLDGTHIPGSPYKLNVHQNRTQEFVECLLSGPALNPEMKFTLGQPVDFTVDATSAPPGDLRVSAVCEEADVAARVVMHQYRQGFFQVNIDPPEVGVYSVSVSHAGNLAPDAPFSVEIVPSDTDASMCRAHGPGLTEATVGERTEFYVSTNRAGRGALAVTVDGLNRSFVVYVDPSPGAPRELCCRFKPRNSGTFFLSLKWSGHHIPGSPYTVEVSGWDLLDGSTDSLADSIRNIPIADQNAYPSSDDDNSLKEFRPPTAFSEPARPNQLSISQASTNQSNDNRIHGVDASNITNGVDTKNITNGVDAKNRISGVDAKNRISGVDTKNRISGVDTKNRMPPGYSVLSRIGAVRKLRKKSEANTASAEVENEKKYDFNDITPQLYDSKNITPQLYDSKNITPQLYDAKNITPQLYDSKNITPQLYDSKNITPQLYDSKNITPQLYDTKNITPQLYDAKNITPQLYDSKNITPQLYDSKNITPQLYDSKNITPQLYDSKNITPQLYDSKNITPQLYDSKNITPQLYDTKNITPQLYDAKNITPQLYDSKNITPQLYDSKNITPQLYDSKNITPQLYDSKNITPQLYDSKNITPQLYDTKNITSQEYNSSGLTTHGFGSDDEVPQGFDSKNRTLRGYEESYWPPPPRDVTEPTKEHSRINTGYEAMKTQGYDSKIRTGEDANNRMDSVDAGRSKWVPRFDAINRIRAAAPAKRMPAAHQDINRLGSGKEDINRIGSGKEDINRIGSGKEDINRIGSGKEDINRTDSAEQAMNRFRLLDKSINRTEKSINRTDSVEKSINRTDSVEKSINRTGSVEKSINRTVGEAVHKSGLRGVSNNRTESGDGLRGGRVLAQISQFEKQIETSPERIANPRTRDTTARERLADKGGVRNVGEKETVSRGVRNVGEKETVSRGVRNVAEGRGANKVSDLERLDKLAGRDVSKVSDPTKQVSERGVKVSGDGRGAEGADGAALERIQRGKVSSLVKKSEEIQEQRASLFDSPSLRHLREAARVQRTKEQLLELSAKSRPQSADPTLRPAETINRTAETINRTETAVKGPDRRRGKGERLRFRKVSADKSKFRTEAVEPKSEKLRRKRESGDFKQRARERVATEEAPDKSVKFSPEVATHHIPKEKPRTGIFGIFDKKEGRQRGRQVSARPSQLVSVPAGIHAQQKAAQKLQRYAPVTYPAFYPPPQYQYIPMQQVYHQGAYPPPQRVATPPRLENFAEQTSLYY